MAIARALPESAYYLVADVDGIVHSAILAIDESKCRLYPSDLHDGRVVYQVYESDAAGRIGPYGGGALVAAVDDLEPRSYVRFADNIARQYFVGAPGVLEVQGSASTFILRDWWDASRIIMRWSSAGDRGLQGVPSTFTGGALLWEAVGEVGAKLKVWTADAGTRDLLSFGADTSQGAGDLGTDGVSLVWLQGSGRTAPHGPYPTASFMVSPFTVNSAGLRPHRLRSEPGGNDAGNALGASKIQVGCGYAARLNPSGVRVLRLTDGVSWVLPGTSASWGWGEPLAVTCSHYYGQALKVGEGASPGWTSTIARLRLDSLGPGEPAD